MQSKGAIRFVAILLAIACLWQLSFTLVTKMQENKAENFAEAAVAAHYTCYKSSTSLQMLYCINVV